VCLRQPAAIQARGEQHASRDPRSQCSTSLTSRGPRLSRNAVVVWSNLGSFDLDAKEEPVAAGHREPLGVEIGGTASEAVQEDHAEHRAAAEKRIVVSTPAR